MRVYCDHVPGQTLLGLFSNLWPTPTSRRDRVAIHGWYLTIHVGLWRLAFIGKGWS